MTPLLALTSIILSNNALYFVSRISSDMVTSIPYVTASRELELTLTGRVAGLDEKVPMCGVPHHTVKTYIEKLVNKGYRVADFIH